MQEIGGMEQMICDHRRKIRNQRNWGIVFRTITLLLCASAVVLALTAIVGWYDQLKVEDTFSKVLLITMMAVLLVVAAIVGLNMLKNRRRFNVALTRLDSLILRLEINDDKNMTTAAINRELQLITRILETQTIIK